MTMIDMNATPRLVTLLHALCLLEEPDCGSRALALLADGDRLQVDAAASGFLHVRTPAGQPGYLPAAICAPSLDGAARDQLPVTHVVQPVALYRRPERGSQFLAPWIVPVDETLLVIGRESRFIRVQRSNGQTGYVPELACGTIAITAGAPYPTTRLRQPVALYSSPTPGDQLSSRWIVSPEETLLVLGGESGFVLAQRDDGQIGYVPAALCGKVAPDQIFHVGPVDLGWMALGGGWGLINWGGLAAGLLGLALVEAGLKPYVGLAALMGVAALLWFAGHRRTAARSFAIGLLLAYALLHLASGGRLTLWR